MSNLNAFIQEIEERKQKEISLLDSTMNDKKTNIQKTKENTIKALQEQYNKEAKTQQTAFTKEAQKQQKEKEQKHPVFCIYFLILTL